MQNNQQENAQPLIICNPGAIAPGEREAHVAASKAIFSPATILEIRELANGYGFRLPLETPMLYKAAEWIANERLCCPFFTFTLVVGEQLWLELSGTPEVKDVIQSDILAMVDTGDFPTLEAAYTAATDESQSTVP